MISKQYKAIFSYTGFILFIPGLLMLTPILALCVYPHEIIYSQGFILPSAVLMITGICFWKGFRPDIYPALNFREGGIIVVSSWIIACTVSAYPFMNILKLNFTQAVFESVSGLTTTGLSVVDVTAAPKIILLWRSIIQLAGGAGLAIIMLAAIAGPSGTGISSAEGRSDQLVPHVRKSAKLVLLIYTGYAVTGTIAYVLVGMNLFDAINHAFAAISTGGFSTRVENIGYWDSPAIEAVSICLMILGNLNFMTAYLLFTGKFRSVFRNCEIRLFAVSATVSVVLLYFFVCKDQYVIPDKAIRVALFEVITALTTTGFSTVGYSEWNAMGLHIMITLMLIGGGTCSTAGAIKQYRVYLLFKSVIWEIEKALLPRTAVISHTVWIGERKEYIDSERIQQVAVFLFFYLSVFALGTGILTGYGYGLKESLFEFASSLGTVGISIGITNANAPSGVLWTETIGMFMGRLEFFVIFISFAKILRDFSDKCCRFAK
ncbi:MAG: cation transporter [Desulfobacteraceae bacterium IS3]|nr:MAG: cation transporter [Desulfobacteraceae bacterium IS3]